MLPLPLSQPLALMQAHHQEAVGGSEASSEAVSPYSAVYVL